MLSEQGWAASTSRAAPAHGPEGPAVHGLSYLGFFLIFVPDSSYKGRLLIK